MTFTVKDFILESNQIEGIYREPTEEEVDAHLELVECPIVCVERLERFVAVYQPDAKLRTYKGMDVRVGSHIPPAGGQAIGYAIVELLDNVEVMTPYEAHVAYEALHPFTDGNGRSGRALWAWHMINTVGGYPLGFLHHFYYQSLDASRG